MEEMGDGGKRVEFRLGREEKEHVSLGKGDMKLGEVR